MHDACGGIATSAYPLALLTHPGSQVYLISAYVLLLRLLSRQCGAPHLRPLLFVDYGQLKSQYKTGVIALHGLDADDHLFPLAIAIVTSEDTASCNFFFDCLTKHDYCAGTGEDRLLEWLHRRDMVIFSHRSTALANAIAAKLPNAHHVYVPCPNPSYYRGAPCMAPVHVLVATIKC